MTVALLERLTSPVTLVAGKGGVGKSTAAAAIALGLADTGRATHLISTDPAHSLGDVLQERAGAEPVRSRCSERLVIEEFDATAHARDWLSTAAGPLTELVERGTYLDEDDVRAFLDLTLPGVDEVMAALRLAELSAAGGARVVVDTAPTGHTLRLLGAGGVVGGWVAAFRAMADKAGTVAEAMVRRRVRFVAEDVLDELEARVRDFEAGVVRAADLVIVTREEPVVAAETERLIRRAEELGARMAVQLRVGSSRRDDRPGGRRGTLVVVPALPDPRGCAGLRRWLESVQADAPRGPTMPVESEVGVSHGTVRAARLARIDASFADVRPLLHREITFFAGKGGVGKTTCAAAAALMLAEDRDVVLVSTDPAGSLGDVLDVDVGREPARITARLAARQVDAAADFERFRERYRAELEDVFTSLGLEDSATLDRRVMDQLWDLSPPGLDEMFALGALLDNAPADGTLVVDSAPTGHFLRLLEMPELALRWTHALLRVLVKYGSVLHLDDTAGSVLRFAKQLKDLKLKLSDPERAATVVVALAEPVVLAETERLLGSLERAGFPVSAVLINRAQRPELPELPVQERAIMLAPALSAAPRGADALRTFFSEWRRVA